MDTGTGTITGIHLAIIGLLAIAAIAVIIWGMKLKRSRVVAAKRFEANQDDTRDATLREQADLGEDPVQAAAQARMQSQTQTQTRNDIPPAATAPLPVAPSFPPIADEPAPGTPPEIGRTTDEAIAAAAPLASPADRPVTALKGLGPKVAAALADRGITTVGQLAALDASQADALDADLGPFRGRLARDRWIEQARFLAAGDVKGFEQVFGRL